jgi:phosphoserine phosphatase
MNRDILMTATQWQLHTPLEAIVFDCDGTLSTIEGIDELARVNGVSKPVKALTAEAMGSTGMNPALYQKRLELVQPTRDQVLTLGEDYFTHCVPDAQAVIELFSSLKKSVYLVSAGLHPAVKIFGGKLQIPQENIFSVDIEFDAHGTYKDYEKTSPMTYSYGKRDIVTEIKARHPRIGFVGDGLNDLAAYDSVSRFVGFGGAYFRQNIADACHYYIRALTLAPLAALLLTPAEVEHLGPRHKKLYDQGVALIQAGEVLIR